MDYVDDGIQAERARIMVILQDAFADIVLAIRDVK